MKTVIYPERRLRLEHFAFFRGHLDGLSLDVLGERYLETGRNRQQAKATLQWIRSELIVAARRASKFSLARLLRVPLERISTPASGTLSLEDFQAQRDPEGFYSESELIKLFQAEAGQDKRAEQRGRLIARLREALTWLETAAETRPQPQDVLAAWIDDSVATRLTATGLMTIGDLQAFIHRHGARWYTKVPRVGQTGGQRLQEWLARNNLLAGSVVPVGVNVPARPLEFDIVPIESLMLPDEMSGTEGSNRGPGTGIAATNDLAAINAWLSSYAQRPHTVRSYRKEAERFLLWMLFERSKPVSSATVEDCIAYRDFLGALGKPVEAWSGRQPQERWIGTRNTQRWSRDWRPFAGPLSTSSQVLAVTVLSAMCEWLRRQRYLETNPWDGVAPVLSIIPRIRADHAMTPAQWRHVLAVCDKQPRDEAYYRLKFTLLAGYWLGFRRSELASMQVAAQQSGVVVGLRPALDGDGWDISVVGKRNKLRSVPMVATVMNALIDYMGARGFVRDPAGWPPGTPLIATLGGGLQYSAAARQPLSGAALYTMLSNHFQRAAIAADSSVDANHLIDASTHWLRHTHATHALAAGAAIHEVQENLGHASVATTAVYSHADRKRRKAAIEKMAELQNPNFTKGK